MEVKDPCINCMKSGTSYERTPVVTSHLPILEEERIILEWGFLKRDGL
jgi:hypothetical protein